MPIQKAVGYKASDGVVYATVEAAQEAELTLIVKEAFTQPPLDQWDEMVQTIVGELMQQGDKVVDVLTTGPRSRPKARKTPGTSNPRKAARRSAPAPPPATPEQAQAGFAAMHAAADTVAA